jgi:predicted hotdog family 3-hydroxylacyl-ACP dehydratase
MKKNILRAEALIPHRHHMKLLDRVVNPVLKELQAEATVAESWPLARHGSASSLLCIELVAQAISALSTWRRGEGARPRPGLLVGIKEAQFFAGSLTVGTRVNIHVEELYHLGNYAVFMGRVSSGSALLCTATLQVMEPEGEDFLNFQSARVSHSAEKEQED